MPWKGRGPTVFPKAVFRSPSLTQPVLRIRKSRFQPSGNGGRSFSSNSIVVSSPALVIA